LGVKVQRYGEGEGVLLKPEGYDGVGLEGYENIARG